MSGGWECPACTYSNAGKEAGFLRCGACGGTRPSDDEAAFTGAQPAAVDAAARCTSPNAVREHSRASASELEDCVWPDPPPPSAANAIGGGCLVNDVSRMSDFRGTMIDRIFFPRDEGDIVDVLEEALRLGRRVAVRGTKHSMGGHSIAPGGFLLDMKCMKEMSYDSAADTVTTGPGALWSDLIVFLNKRCKAPRTMQSYCTFSVGGTLAVNAHGITTDFCFAESVVSFRLAHVVPAADGRGHRVKITTCHPGDELFRLALGGYGLFGVITEATLRVVDNMQLELDTLDVKVDGGEFVAYYEEARRCSEKPSTEAGKDEGEDSCSAEAVARQKVAVKIARLNILDLNRVQLFVYRRAYSCNTISGTLGLHAHVMPMKTRLLYKWLMPAMKEVRFAIEGLTGQAIDMADETGVTRNELLFESAVPLAKLYEPMFVSDDSFVLQEYFVPAARFGEWIERARPIYRELTDAHGESARQRLMLLNTTIRFVEHDTFTFLSYAGAPGGSYAFVLYYRIPRTAAADEALGRVHNTFAEMTVDLGGTFYLPYRKCYSQELLARAYPQIHEFAAKKQAHDQLGMFSNCWFDHYVRPLCAAGYGEAFLAGSRLLCEGPFERVDGGGGALASHLDLPRAGDADLVARSGSYRALLSKQRLREEFQNLFLTKIFNLADNKEVMRAMTKAAWNPRNADDLAIFRSLREHFHGRAAPVATTTARQRPRDLDLAFGATATDEDKNDDGDAPVENACDEKWTSAELAAKCCDTMVAAGKLRATPAFIREGQEAKLVKIFEGAKLDGAKVLQCKNASELEVIIRNATEGEDWVDHVQSAMKTFLPADIQRVKVGTMETRGGGGAVAKLKRAIAGIKQLHRQKIELVRETAAILARLGKARGRSGDAGDFTYASFGDNGKLVLKLRTALGLRGKSYVCHDAECGDDDLPAILERGSLDPVGEYVKFDYMEGLVEEEHGNRTADEVCAAAADGDPGAWLAGVRARIPDASVDLATINQGLHHIPPARLIPYLREVGRILRPGGVFLIREHDLDLDRARDRRRGCPVEVLDLAHSVFNAITGVTEAVERAEVRAFRPLSEWRAIVCGGAGLVDAMLEGLEEGDPTCDEMLAFYKPPLHPAVSEEENRHEGSCSETAAADGDVSEPPIVTLVKTLLSQIPAAAIGTLESLTGSLAGGLKALVPKLRELLLTTLPRMTGNAAVAGLEPSVSKYVGVAVDAVDLLRGLVAEAEVKDHLDVDVLHGEFFLIIPAIERKVRLRPDAASEAEKTFIRVVRDYMPALLLTATSATVDGGGDETKAAVEPAVATDGDVRGSEVLAAVEQLATHVPGLLSPKTLRQSGFNLRQQTALVGKFGGRDLASTAATLAGFLDRATWVVVRRELEGVAAAGGGLPTRDRLLGESRVGRAHAWHRVARAFLRSPRVRLEKKGKFALKVIGLGALVDLHDGVKAEVDAERRAGGGGSAAAITTVVPRLPRACLAAVHAGTCALAELGGVEASVTLRFDDGADKYVLEDVGVIVSATFGYKSLTSAPSDITKQMRAMHAAQVRERGGAPGRLVVREGACVRARNSASGFLEGLDEARATVVKLGTLGLAGNNKLKLKYRRLECGQGATDGRAKLEAAAETIRGALRGGGATRDLHGGDGEFTWYKLNEWMQVEILEVMAASLDHTPWYRFPFFEVLGVYFDVLRTESDLVAAKYGPVKAYASMAFVTDLVPAIVMSALFAQLHLMAMPLRAALGGEGYLEDGADPERFLEEIVLYARIKGEASLAAFFRGAVDPRISEVKAVEPHLAAGGGQIIVLTVPPFKALGEILVALARAVPTARVLEISNQSEVQVRVSCEAHREAEAEAWLARLRPGVEPVARYQFPIAAESATAPARKQIALRVAVTQLMSLMRGCGDEGGALRVEQVYDFWCG